MVYVNSRSPDGNWEFIMDRGSVCLAENLTGRNLNPL